MHLSFVFVAIVTLFTSTTISHPDVAMFEAHGTTVARHYPTELLDVWATRTLSPLQTISTTIMHHGHAKVTCDVVEWNGYDMTDCYNVPITVHAVNGPNGPTLVEPTSTVLHVARHGHGPIDAPWSSSAHPAAKTEHIVTYMKPSYMPAIYTPTRAKLVAKPTPPPVVQSAKEKREEDDATKHLLGNLTEFIVSTLLTLVRRIRH
jgi:hypothetical protein